MSSLYNSTPLKNNLFSLSDPITDHLQYLLDICQYLRVASIQE